MNAPREAAVLSLVGNPPMIPLRFRPEGVTIWAKCACFNRSGRVKDRCATHVVADGFLPPWLQDAPLEGEVAV